MARARSAGFWLASFWSLPIWMVAVSTFCAAWVSRSVAAVNCAEALKAIEKSRLKYIVLSFYHGTQNLDRCRANYCAYLKICQCEDKPNFGRVDEAGGGFEGRNFF